MFHAGNANFDAGDGLHQNTGKCSLKWFSPGDNISLSLRHVFDFLHRLGGYMHSMTGGDARSATWHFNGGTPTCLQPHRVISYVVFVSPFPTESEVAGFGLFVSVLFADGIASTCEIARADSSAGLHDRFEALREAPADDYGGPIDPEVGHLDWRAIYLNGRRILAEGGVPVDPGSPWIHFREPDGHNAA